MRPLALSLLFASLCSIASADQWATKLFENREHDFGAIARGSKAEYAFEFKNTLDEPIQIADVETSCGCTTPKISKRTIAPGETSSIIAKYNTRSFLGKKSATITVYFTAPTQDQVSLTITGYIRRDIVIHPGEIDFGEVSQSDTTEKAVEIKYAGREDWQIVDVQSDNQYFEVELVETERAGIRVGYEMLVRLTPGSKPGFFRDQLTIVTDDPKLQYVPLTVHGTVNSALTVSPSSLFLGVLEAGESVTKKLVVRGKEPFKIVSVSCEADDSFAFDATTDTAKSLHFIPITFTAGATPGKISEKIEIMTDLGDGTVASCVATATVRAAGAE